MEIKHVISSKNMSNMIIIKIDFTLLFIHQVPPFKRKANILKTNYNACNLNHYYYICNQMI